MSDTPSSPPAWLVTVESCIMILEGSDDAVAKASAREELRKLARFADSMRPRRVTFEEAFEIQHGIPHPGYDVGRAWREAQAAKATPASED